MKYSEEIEKERNSRKKCTYELKTCQDRVAEMVLKYIHCIYVYFKEIYER